MTTSSDEQARTTDQANRSRECVVDGIPVHYVEQGSGIPLLALHGWWVDHRFMTGMLEPIFGGRPGYRRIYADSPGMGRTPAPASVNSSDDILDALLGLVDGVIGDEPFLLVGHSHGGYMARAIANRRPDQVAGLAVINPLGPGGPVPDHVVFYRAGDLDGILDPSLEGEYGGYLVVQTPETLRLFQEREGPGYAVADGAALERIYANFALRQQPEAAAEAFTKPTLILTGRQDSFVGYALAWEWLDHYPRATYVVLDQAGHGLPHEQVALVDALITEWLDRVSVHRAASGQ